MKRYETFLDKHCGQPFANIEEDANGGLVMIRSCFELEMGLDVPIDFDPEGDDAWEM